MAHGTGLYWNKQYKADLQNDEYVVTFYRLYNYYYAGMSDSVEPDCEAKDEYRVEVSKWRKDRFGHEIADHMSDMVKTGSIDKNTANTIFWNLKNRNIRFEEIEKYFKTLAG